MQVLATCGDNHLGGDDFDARVADWLVRNFAAENQVDLTRDPVAMQRVREEAEKAKKELSAATHTEINLPFITVGPNGPLHLQAELTRAKFDELTAGPGGAHGTAGAQRPAGCPPGRQRPGSGAAGRWFHPHPGGAGQGHADDRSGTVQNAEPGRVCGPWRCGAGADALAAKA